MLGKLWKHEWKANCRLLLAVHLALLAMGLVKGGSLDAAAIIHDGAIICKEALRYPNEIVRHKILDIVGDVYLSGCRITGTIIAIKPGHPKNVELAGMLQKEIMAANNA